MSRFTRLANAPSEKLELRIGSGAPFSCTLSFAAYIRRGASLLQWKQVSRTKPGASKNWLGCWWRYRTSAWTHRTRADRTGHWQVRAHSS